jgi:hypothetical protein
MLYLRDNTMPKSNRDFMKRDIARAYYNIQLSIDRLVPMYNLFNPVHPELGEMLQSLIDGLFMCQEVIKAFIKQAWGIEEPNILGWINSEHLKEE